MLLPTQAAIGMKCYRIGQLLVRRAEDLRSMHGHLSDTHMLLCAGAMVLLEVLLLCLYSWAGKPRYVDEGCGVFCTSVASNRIVALLIAPYHRASLHVTCACLEDSCSLPVIDIGSR